MGWGIQHLKFVKVLFVKVWSFRWTIIDGCQTKLGYILQTGPWSKIFHLMWLLCEPTTGTWERKPRQMLTCGLECTVVQSWEECWVRNVGSMTFGPQMSLWPTKWRLEGYQGKNVIFQRHRLKSTINFPLSSFNVMWFMWFNWNYFYKVNSIIFPLLTSTPLLLNVQGSNKE